MNVQTRKYHLVALLISMLLTASCARLSIEPPGPSNQSLLVLPVTHTNKAQQLRHGFYYVYEITRDDEQTPPVEIDIKFPLEGDMLIVNSLPPGKYHVSKFSTLPLGSGDHTYNNIGRPRYDSFTLLPGTITIFDKSLNLLTYNATAGRGLSTSYRVDIDPLSKQQKRKILLTLGQLEHFQSWQVHGYK